MTFRQKISNFAKLFVEHLCEKMSAVRPTLIATVDYRQEWEDDETGSEHDEEITFYLLEYPSGMREWKVHEYGMSAETFSHEAYLKDVLTWVYGGPLPPKSKKIGATVLEVISIDPLQQPPTAP